jgi:hypothetical protein
MFFYMPDLFPPIVPRIYLPPSDIRSEGVSFKSQVFQGFAALAPVVPAPVDHGANISFTWHERGAAAADTI